MIVLVPTALQVSGGGRRGRARVMMQAVPDWSPTNWFLGLFEVIRRSSADEFKTAGSPWIDRDQCGDRSRHRCDHCQLPSTTADER